MNPVDVGILVGFGALGGLIVIFIWGVVEFLLERRRELSKVQNLYPKGNIVGVKDGEHKSNPNRGIG